MKDNDCTGNGTLNHDMLTLVHGTCTACGLATSTPKPVAPPDIPAQATRGVCEKRGDSVVYVTQQADGLTSYRYLTGSWR